VGKADHITPSTDVFRHAEGGQEASERTLCGMVLLGVNEDGEGAAVLTAPGNVVTCPSCRQIIADAQSLYTGNFRRRRGR
jgi:hypothetical protein